MLRKTNGDDEEDRGKELSVISYLSQQTNLSHCLFDMYVCVFVKEMLAQSFQSLPEKEEKRGRGKGKR